MGTSVTKPKIWASNWLRDIPLAFRTDKLEIGSEAFQSRCTAFNWPMCNYLPADSVHAPKQAWGYIKLSHMPDSFSFKMASRASVPGRGRRWSGSILAEAGLTRPRQRSHSHENYMVNPPLDDGADLWGDPNLADTFFFSDALATVIKEEKLQGMKLFPCTIVSP